MAKGLNATVRLVQSLHHEIKEFAVGLAAMRITQTSVDETVKQMSRLLTASEPSSLTIRLVIAERELDNLRQWKVATEHSHREVNAAAERVRWQIRVAVISSVLSVIGSLAVAITLVVLKQ